jgi:hypothetical protein
MNTRFVEAVALTNDKDGLLEILSVKWSIDKEMAMIALETEKIKTAARISEADARKAEADARKAEVETGGILAKEKTEQMRIQMEMKTKDTNKSSTPTSLTLFDLLRCRRVTMDVANWAIRNADQLPNTKLRHIAAPAKAGLTRGLTTDIVFEGESDSDKIAKQLIDMAVSVELNNDIQTSHMRKAHTVKLKTALQKYNFTLSRLDDAAALLRRAEPDEIDSIVTKNGSGLPQDYITAELETRLVELLPPEWRYVNLQDYLRSIGVAESDVQRLANYAFNSKHNTNKDIIVLCRGQKKPSDYQFMGSDTDKVRRDILLNIAELGAIIDPDYKRSHQHDEQRQFIEPS